MSQFPLVPGHEIVGTDVIFSRLNFADTVTYFHCHGSLNSFLLGHVVQVGGKVKSFKAGDNVAVGCVVDSCESCEQCNKGEEQYCLKVCCFASLSCVQPHFSSIVYICVPIGPRSDVWRRWPGQPRRCGCCYQRWLLSQAHRIRAFLCQASKRHVA